MVIWPRFRAWEDSMENKVSKSKFKPRALEYFRQIQFTGKEMIITERGQPVLKIMPFKTNSKDALADSARLRPEVRSSPGPRGPRRLGSPPLLLLDTHLWVGCVNASRAI